MSDRTAKRIQLISAAFIVLVLAFGYGVAVAHYKIWPFRLIQDSSYAVGSIVRAGEVVPRGRRIQPPDEAARERFTVRDPARIGDGQFVFLGSDDSTHAYSAWLYDTTGRRLHTWRIDYRALDPSGPSSGTDMPHAFQVLRDGSAIVSFDGGDVMARIDACGNPIWIREGIFHHSMTVADDGSVWVWRADGSHYAQYHYLLNFDAETGATIREIGLIEDVIQKLGSQAEVFGLRHDYPFRRVDRDPEDRDSFDFFHPNDVDVLSAALAPHRARDRGNRAWRAAGARVRRSPGTRRNRRKPQRAAGERGKEARALSQYSRQPGAQPEDAAGRDAHHPDR
jgi:hypothetical protein